MGENTRPKGYDNDKLWQDNIETKTKTIINPVDEEAFYSQLDNEFCSEEQNSDSNQEDDIFPTESYQAEILQLTPFVPGARSEIGSTESGTGITLNAEYTNIAVVELQQQHQLKAKQLVDGIVKFIKGFKDVELTQQHKEYLDIIAEFQMTHLSHLLYIVDVNKQMLDNMVHRINMVQAEDYAMLNTYNNLANQHIKLMKELSNTYKNIPANIKKMRTEVMCNQELGSDMEKNQLNDANTQTKTGRDLLEILEKRRQEQNNNDKQTPLKE